MTHCPRCGKTALQPDAIHTCTPKALVLADALLEANWSKHDWEAAAELRRLHEENDAKDTLLRQVLNDICGAKLCEVNSMSSRAEARRLLDKATDAIRARLEGKA